ncbi:MAG: hypothetical protein QW701_01275 [Candidatus Nezhaarchaeales archaeon]
MVNPIDPLELSEEVIERTDVNEYLWNVYREKLLSKPRKKKYWQKEYEYRQRVLKVLEEIRDLKSSLPEENVK